MNNTIDLIKTAANQTIIKQAISANNLANISTPGFKSQLRYLSNVISNPDETQETISNSFQYDLSNGILKHTNKPLDIALSDHYWLELRDNKNQDFYTRNGHCEINNKGELIIQGLHVMNQLGKPMQIPINSIPSFDKHGMLSAIVKNNDNGNAILEIGELKTKYIEDNNLYKHINGFFRLKHDSTSTSNKSNNYDDSIQVFKGFTEESNVNPTENIIDMINDTRQFDMEMNMVTNFNNNEQKANSILNINN
ncbi:MAG: flagellar basal body rod C-terminal domain-containing protein [Buchnera aphidicola (Eriosoma harunire)]